MSGPPRAPVVITLHGHVDSSKAADFERTLEYVADAASGVVVELSDAESIDSVMLAELIGAHKGMAERGLRLAVVAPSAAVRRVLEVTGLQARLHVHPTSASATDFVSVP